MKITTETVRKLIIQDIPNLDPVAVYLEDQGPGKGKITITCFNDSWSYFWGAMGEGRNLVSFFLSCDNDYLAKKLGNGIHSTVQTSEGLVEKARKTILTERRENILTEGGARDLFERAEELDSLWDEFEGKGGEDYFDLMYAIFGDEFWHNVPTIPNHKYVYLCRIIDTVKEALRFK